MTYLIFIMNVEWRGGGERIVEDKYQQRQRSESIDMFGGVSSRPGWLLCRLYMGREKRNKYRCGAPFWSKNKCPVLHILLTEMK